MPIARCRKNEKRDRSFSVPDASWTRHRQRARGLVFRRGSRSRSGLVARRTEGIARDHHAVLVLATQHRRAGHVRRPAKREKGGRGWTSDFSPGVRAGEQISNLARADPRVGGRADARARRRVARDARKYYVGRRYSLRVRDRTGGDAERPPDAVRPHVRDGSLMVRVLRVVGGIDARRHHAGADDGVVADARGDHLRGVVEVVDCAEPRSRPVGVRVACATSTSFPSMETSQRPRTRKLPFLEFSFGVTWHILPRGVPGVETGVSPRRERWGSARRRSPRS